MRFTYRRFAAPAPVVVSLPVLQLREEVRIHRQTLAMHQTRIAKLMELRAPEVIIENEFKMMARRYGLLLDAESRLRLIDPAA